MWEKNVVFDSIILTYWSLASFTEILICYHWFLKLEIFAYCNGRDALIKFYIKQNFRLKFAGRNNQCI